MKKAVIFSFIAVFAIVALSSFINLSNNKGNELGKNKDFKKWVSAMTTLKNQIEKTNTKNSFIGFLKSKNSIVENIALATKLGYSNEKDLSSALDQINKYKQSFIKATPELKTDNGQTILKNALEQNMNEVPSCWEVYTIRSMNCFSGSTSPPEEAACEAAAWNALLNCYDSPFIP